MVRKFFYLWGVLALLFWLSNLAYANFISHASLDSWALESTLYMSLLFMFTVALVIMLIWTLFRKKK